MIYIDGTLHKNGNDAKISVFDHGLLYGDGVFEGIRVYRGRPFRLQAHLDRLFAGARAMRLEVPETAARIAELINGMIESDGRREAYIRLVVTRGAGDLGLNPRTCPRPSLVIILDDISLYPREFYEQGITLCTASWRRPPADCLNPRIKSLNYLNNVLAKIEANDRGCHEALILNKEGLVAECTADNVFYAERGRLFTPDLSAGALEGVTRGAVLELAASLGIEAAERRVNLYDLYAADECFLTGTGAELVPAVEIDGRAVGAARPGPIFARIREAFARLVEEESALRPEFAGARR
ncbi:MAG: branched-chain-amino-acid transaminase [Spirochaetales bacterium]|nr:branched-chain-amino-acid transaminase [Spirochaetales bacterium]